MILNPKMLEQILANKSIKLELGAGGASRKEGFFSLDRLPLEGVDIVADLNQPLTELPNNSVSTIFCRHTLEHVKNLLGLMEEVHRITIPSGVIKITVPHFSNVYGMSDPTHIHFFGIYSMYYFVDQHFQPTRKVPAFYSTARFTIERIKIGFYRHSRMDKVIAPLFQRIFNRSFKWQEFYERRLAFLYHAWQITYIMRPAK
jgi:hypothetical protein